ncbi:hypothetical protein BSLA_03r0212 [Burkholderia stabilis]|nr:hypothetical protein BSLA_03r0212 [Burkholderia stabilis]
MRVAPSVCVASTRVRPRVIRRSDRCGSTWPVVVHAVLTWIAFMTSTRVSSATRAWHDSETSVVRQKIDDE